MVSTMPQPRDLHVHMIPVPRTPRSCGTPGGQALSRYVLDHPECVAGKRVLDLASGSGLVAMAALRAGASSVLANEIDPYAIAAIDLNAAVNGLDVPTHLGDLLDAGIATDIETETGTGTDADVLLAGDVFYSRRMADRMLAFMCAARAGGTDVLIGDPGRAYVPGDGLTKLAEYDVPVIRDLEDADVKRSVVWRLP